MSKINLNTVLALGTVVRRNSTKELFTIGRMVERRYEMRPNGRRTDITDGILFVATIDELSKNYELPEQR